MARRPTIMLHRENIMDHLGKRLALNREFQTGDAEFDAAVNIDTCSPDEDVQRIFADGAFRNAVRKLLDAGGV